MDDNLIELNATDDVTTEMVITRLEWGKEHIKHITVICEDNDGAVEIFGDNKPISKNALYCFALQEHIRQIMYGDSE